MQIHIDANYPHIDLIAKAGDQRISVSERLDRKQLSEAQAITELQNGAALLVAEERRRESQARRQ